MHGLMEGSLWCLKNEMAEAISLPFRFGFFSCWFPLALQKPIQKVNMFQLYATPPPRCLVHRDGCSTWQAATNKLKRQTRTLAAVPNLGKDSTAAFHKVQVHPVDRTHQNPLRTPPSLKGSQSESTISGSTIGLGWPCVACSPKRKGKNDPPKGVQFGRQLHPQIPLPS